MGKAQGGKRERHGKKGGRFGADSVGGKGDLQSRGSSGGVFGLIALMVLVGVVVLITHWPGLKLEAASFDDPQYLLNN